MKMFLTTILLSASIILTTLAIHTNNVVYGWIGGTLVAIYNAMMYKQD